MFSNTLPIIQESDCTLLISIIRVNSVVYYSTLTNSFDFNKTSCFLLALFFVLLINNKTHHCKKMKFSIKNFFSKCDRIRRKMQISSQLLKKLETLLFFFFAVHHSQRCTQDPAKYLQWDIFAKIVKSQRPLFIFAKSFSVNV